MGGAFATLDRLRGARAASILECARENGDLVSRASRRRISRWSPRPCPRIRARSRSVGASAHRAGTRGPAHGRGHRRSSRGHCRQRIGIDAGRHELQHGRRTRRGEHRRPGEPRDDLEWAIDQIGRCAAHDGVEIGIRDRLALAAARRDGASLPLFGLSRSSWGRSSALSSAPAVPAARLTAVDLGVRHPQRSTASVRGRAGSLTTRVPSRPSRSRSAAASWPASSSPSPPRHGSRGCLRRGAGRRCPVTPATD